MLGVIGTRGNTVNFLKSMKIGMGDARLLVEERLVPGKGSSANAIEIPLSELSKQTLEQAWKYARSFRQPRVGTEHILLALLEAGQSELLEQLGAEPEYVREECVLMCENFQEASSAAAAQLSLNEIKAREQFFQRFPAEAKNIIEYSLHKSDALHIIVDIVGKVLQASRCLIICEVKAKHGFQCYEYWHQGRVRSCQEFFWPEEESRLVSCTMQSSEPHVYLDAEDGSVDSEILRELQKIQAKTFLGIALRSGKQVFGCMVLHRCEASRPWDDSEISFVRGLADKVADHFAVMGY